MITTTMETHVFCDSEMFDNIRKAAMAMQLKANGGQLALEHVGDFPGFEKEAWLSDDEKCITNILSFLFVREDCPMAMPLSSIESRRGNGWNDNFT